MDRLVDTVHAALAVGNTAQTGTGQKTQGAGDDTRLVADDIAKQVAGDNDTVQLARILNHEHGRRVNEVVTDRHLRELLGHNLSHDLAPQTAGREDVGLVQTPYGQRRVVLQGQVRSQAGDALNLGARVWLRVHGVSGPIVFLPLTEVDAAGQLTDDVEIDTAAHFSLQRRAVDQRWRGEVAGSQVAESAHLLAQAQDTLLGTHRASAPFLFMTVREYVVSRVFFGGCVERTGPPMAPRSTASAFLAASRASSVKGEPFASMEAWNRVSALAVLPLSWTMHSHRRASGLAG